MAERQDFHPYKRAQKFSVAVQNIPHFIKSSFHALSNFVISYYSLPREVLLSMPTELEELVEFLHHGNTEIRQTAVTTLIPFSKLQPNLFSSNDYTPIKDLQLLIRDYYPIAENAATILINLSSSPSLALQAKITTPTTFITSLLSLLLRPQGPKTRNNGASPHSLSLLLANLTKLSQLESLTTLRLEGSKQLAVDQLLDLYNASPHSSPHDSKDTKHDEAEAERNNVDHLSYTFANLTTYPTFQTHLLTPSQDSQESPLSILLPHTTSPSPIRRLGTALLLRNLALGTPSPLSLLSPSTTLSNNNNNATITTNPTTTTDINILPPLLLPLCSNDQSTLTEEELDSLPLECQLLGPDHEEEKDPKVLEALIEAVYLLAARGGRDARRVMREGGTYYVVREGHLRWSRREGLGKVVEFCEKVVDLLMGDEEGEGGRERIEEVEEEEDGEDEGEGDIVPIF